MYMPVTIRPEPATPSDTVQVSLNDDQRSSGTSTPHRSVYHTVLTALITILGRVHLNTTSKSICVEHKLLAKDVLCVIYHIANIFLSNKSFWLYSIVP